MVKLQTRFTVPEPRLDFYRFSHIRTILWAKPIIQAQPLWGCFRFESISQGSSFLATLGWRTYPRWGWIRWVRFRIPSLVLYSLPSCMNTPTGYWPKAQGHEERATLGQHPKHPTNQTGLRQDGGSMFEPAQPLWGCFRFESISQGSSFLATLGWRTYPRWGWIRWVRFRIPSLVLYSLPSCMNTPTGYWPKAQGHEERATLGQHPKHPTNPNGVTARWWFDVRTGATPLGLFPF